jgi:hemolysin activation/secretion protein
MQRRQRQLSPNKLFPVGKGLLSLPLLICGALLTTASLAQTPTPREPRINPRDIVPLPPSPPQPERPPELPENPEDLLPAPPTPADPTVPPEVLEVTFFVTAIEFQGNTIFDTATLAQLVRDALQDPSPTWTPQRLTVSELLQLAQVISQQYADAGYTASGALVRIPPETQSSGIGSILFDIQEGEVESIAITGTQRLREGYVRSRLGIIEGQPLNVTDFQERLQLLQINPLIDGIRAEVNQGATPASSLVTVSVEEARSFSASLGLNNSRPPSVGTFQQQVFLTQANLLGLGDGLSIGYSRTEGSDSLSAFYELPLGSNGTTLSLSYSPGWNDIVDPNFFDINRDGQGPDIQSESDTYEVQLRYPAIRSVKNQTYQELGFSFIGSLRDSRSFLLGEPFPLSAGAAVDGRTRVVALRLGQDYTLRDGVQVLAVRSRFNFGLEALGSTINQPVPGVGLLPDSDFFSWTGQIQWVRVLAPETLLVMRSNLELADQWLPSSEQFGIGGSGSVRGYRQDQLLTDNGIFASAEVRIPVLRIPEWQSTVQVAPFVDFGSGWNSGAERNPNPNTLASVGAGLQWLTSDNFTARLDIGIPLIEAGSGGNSWQENGIQFSVLYTPF